MENLLPFEYCKLDRAARMLGCEVDDLIHWGAIGAIELSIYLVKPIKCWLRHIPVNNSCNLLMTNPVIINNGITNYAGVTNNDDEINCFCSGVWSLSRKTIECLECSESGKFAISADVLSASDNRWQFIVWVMFGKELIIKPSSLWITKEQMDKINENKKFDESIQNIQNIHNNEIAEKTETQNLDIRNVISRPALRKNMIIKEIEKMGIDPLNLPKQQNGKAGIKSEVKKNILGSSAKLFTDSTFNVSWQDLRNDGLLKEIK